MRILSRYALHFASMIAFVATSASLYISEILQWTPCKLCWIERICMYPLVIILSIATYYNDRHIIKYLLPFTLSGSLISLYHHLLQKVPGLVNIAPCQIDAICKLDHFVSWITIPFLGFVSFLAITVLLIIGKRKGHYVDD